MCEIDEQGKTKQNNIFLTEMCFTEVVSVIFGVFFCEYVAFADIVYY